MTAAERTEAQLSPAELEAAFRAAGIRPAPGSPFAGDPSAPPAEAGAQLAALQRQGVLDGGGAPADGWPEALAVLAGPSHRLRLHWGGADRWQQLDCYLRGNLAVSATRPPAAGALPAPAPPGPIHFPRTPEDLLASSREWMGWGDIPRCNAFSAELSGHELVAVAAAVDAYREEHLRALLERRGAVEDRFEMPALEQALQVSNDLPDCRWMAGILRFHAPEPFQPLPPHLPAGLEALFQRGWISGEGDSVVFQGPLLQVCRGMANLTPYLALECGPVPRQGTSIPPPGVLLAVRGLAAFWALEFPAEPGASARLSALAGSLVEAMLETRLEQLWAAAASPSPAADGATAPTAAVGASCRGCGAALDDLARFCPRCGQPVQPPAPAPAGEGAFRPCPACGAPAPTGAAFCPRCGVDVTARSSPGSVPDPGAFVLPQSPSPPAPVAPPSAAVAVPTPAARSDPPQSGRCANPACGAPLAAGKRFCTRCGSPVPP